MVVALLHVFCWLGFVSLQHYGPLVSVLGTTQ